MSKRGGWGWGRGESWITRELGVGAARMMERGMDRSSSWGPRVWGTRLCKVMGGGRNGKDLGRNETSVGAGGRAGHIAIIEGDSFSGEGVLGSPTVEAQDGGTGASLGGLG